MGELVTICVTDFTVPNNYLNIFLIKVSYAIGVAEPMSIFVDSYGTSWYTNEQLTDIVKHNFDLRPGAIVKYVNTDFNYYNYYDYLNCYFH